MRIFILAVLLMAPATPTATPEGFVCPITAPSDVQPAANETPFAADQSIWYENGIWVTLPPDGVLELSPHDEVAVGKLRGWRSTTLTWMRADGVEGYVIVSGKRLDAPSNRSPQSPLSPERQYVQLGAVRTGIAFPSAGCWQVTGTVGENAITWVVDVRFADAVGTPIAG